MARRALRLALVFVSALGVAGCGGDGTLFELQSFVHLAFFVGDPTYEDVELEVTIGDLRFELDEYWSYWYEPIPVGDDVLVTVTFVSGADTLGMDTFTQSILAANTHLVHGYAGGPRPTYVCDVGTITALPIAGAPGDSLFVVHGARLKDGPVCG